MLGLITFILGLWVIALLTYTWVLKAALRESEEDLRHQAGQYLDWKWRTHSANRRRKRLERILCREQRRSLILRQEVAGLHHKLFQQECRNESLAADLVLALVNYQNKAAVREALVRKIR